MSAMGEIQNDRVRVHFRFTPGEIYSERFEAIGVMDQITLDGRYMFCEPEQRRPGRVTCHGVGLCGEYVWDELAQEAAPGQEFPKLGVGLLTQRPEGGRYNMWKHYDVTPFPSRVSYDADRAVFIQEPVECLGVAAEIVKEVWLEENTIHTRTTVTNAGERPLELSEYQHNFVSLNGLEIGPGYFLDVPFDATLHRISKSAFNLDNLDNLETRLSGFMETSGNSVYWLRPMDGHGYHKITEKSDLHMENGAYWRLRHTVSPLSVKERISFQPSRLVIWGIEHCVCAEVYVPICVPRGGAQTWERTWIFED